MTHDTIDTRVGTQNYPGYSNGNTLPFTGVPFGMNYFAPQNDEGSWWFNPSKPLFAGFRCTHQPSPWMGDFSSFLITPFTTEPLIRSVFHLQSSYRIEEAVYNPGYLKLTSQRYALESELTASTYGMKLQNTSLRSESVCFVVSAIKGIHDIRIDEKTISYAVVNASGSEDPNFTMYAHMTLDVPFTAEASTFEDGTDIIIIRTTSSYPTITVATSFINSQQAKLNASRLPSTFESMLANAKEAWEQKLSKVEVTHTDKEAVTMFYAALYRCFLFPQTFYELDTNNEPIHYNTITRSSAPGVLFTNNGFWDTYKSLFPLFSLIEPEHYELMLEGFLNSFHEAGYLPKWLSPDERGLMPGTLVDAVISDALTKGLAHDKIESLYEAMKQSATVESENPQYGRRAVNDYWKYGYVPSSYHESVNQSLDNSYSDFCIAQVAKMIGRTDDYQTFMDSSKNYAQLFDSNSGLMRAKDTDGNFSDSFSDIEWGHAYTEGSSWQNSWAVYHDFAGLIKLYDSKQAYLDKITHLVNQKPYFTSGSYGFEIHEMSEVAAIDFGQMAISNQPSFHIPYLFTYGGEPASTQVLLRSLMRETFKPTFTGYPGDEDNGSMSAWYVFNAMGFYPVSPGTQEYVVGIPFFDTVTVNLPNGEVLQINTENNTRHHNFVSKMMKDGTEYTALYLKHNDLIQGTQLDFELGIVPRQRQYTDDELPFSMSQ